MKKRLNIGLMIEIEGTIDTEGYKTILRNGISRCCGENNYNLVCFGGGSLARSPYEFADKERNIIYQMMTRDMIDGLIITATTLSYATDRERQKFLDKIRKIPVVIIGPQAGSLPGIGINNELGLIHVVRHIIEVHQRKKIAFIKGPNGNEESGIRFQAYLDALKQSGIHYNPHLVTEGNFLMETGMIAVRTLLNRSNAEFDAIVASNDNMALGALHELNTRRISVPESVSLAGFDDCLKAKTTIPPLTTVRQPIYELGYQAVLCLKNILEKKSGITEYRLLPAELIIRQSCGCFSNKPVHSDKVELITRKENDRILDENTITIQKMVLRDTGNIYIGSMEIWLKQLIVDLISDLKLEDTLDSGFLKSLYYTMLKFESNLNSLNSFNMLMNSINQDISAYIRSKEYCIKMNEINLNAQILISNIEKNAELSGRLKSELQIEKLYQITQTLFLKNNIQSIVSTLSQGLPELNIRNCFLLLHDLKNENSTNRQQFENSRLVYSTKPVESIKNGLEDFYQTKTILKLIFKQEDPYYYIFLPLFSGKKQMGLVLFEPGPEEAIVYETLRNQISNSIYNAYLVAKSEEASKKMKRALLELDRANKQMEKLYIKDELTGLYNRRGFFTLANKVWEMASRSKIFFIIFFFDLDNLKTTNDNYGHEEGDVMIKAFANILNLVFRKDDILCRQGGDEFLVLAYGISRENEVLIETKLDQAITDFNDHSKKPYKLSASFGYACFDPETPRSLNELIKTADDLLYKNKFSRKLNKRPG